MKNAVKKGDQPEISQRNLQLLRNQAKKIIKTHEDEDDEANEAQNPKTKDDVKQKGNMSMLFEKKKTVVLKASIAD